MFFKLSSAVVVATSSLVILAAASPTDLTERGGSAPAGCTTGSTQCCSSTSSTSDPLVSTILGLLNIVVSGVDIPIGLGCSPLNIIGIGGNTCTNNVVCCDNTDDAGGLLSGLIGIGCIPIIATL
ncbi:fungal hydrophobin [Punctularia strigosozonata HHB-11173 SS5]|uniref:Hydrophobin n=1 Tax=Punctularia strigosozonata (strain HHB-11173) TaxID=741275 RepID=R7S3N8_PUNST|nr:fungal hydrophobin [Punctularia strigosozonata HHB-11173 SS5]EIN05015.1 fungal hydrophobin [Punctularia strigosozonata HHB-11173 SS5]